MRRTRSRGLRSLHRLAAAAAAAALLAACATKIGGNSTASPEGRPCASDRDCPQPSNPCQVWTCWQEVCTPVPAARDTVLPEAAQAAGDCKLLVCDGQGKATSLPDKSDAPPEDDNPCAEEVCQDGEPAYPPVAVGTPCGKNGLCNGHGKCGFCLPDTERCNGNAPETCSADGTWESEGPCPAGEPVCSGRRCLAISEIAAGNGFTCVRLADGKVRCFGDPSDGRLGDRGAQRVSGLSGVTQIAAGGQHTCALVSDQTVQCWGSNTFGQLGDATEGARGVPAPVLKLAKVTQISAGDLFSCARLEDGTAVCWGDNQYGQLGTGPGPHKAIPSAMRAARASAQDRPGAVAGLAAAVQLSLGGSHACARLADGGVSCWGGDADGQLGRGSPPAQPPKKPPRPVKPLFAVKGLKDVVEVAAGGDHACARLADGTVACWGRNHHGQLGDGTTKAKTTPVKVGGLGGVTQLALGAAHSCALLKDGTVRCWGAGGSKVIGDPAGADRTAPAEVPGISRAWALATGAEHACAGVKRPAIVCWGDNRYGQLGSASTGDEPQPIVW